MGVHDLFEEGVELVPQRGIFMAKHMLTSTMSAIAFGLCGGVVGAVMLPSTVGPIVPYLVCSTIGFACSSVSMWDTEKRSSLDIASRFPDVVQHHLRHSFVENGVSSFDVRKMTSSQLRALSVGQTTAIMLAVQSASKDVNDINERIIAAMVDRHANIFSERIDDEDDTGNGGEKH